MHYESLMFSKSQFEYYRVFEELSKLPKRPYPLRNLASLTDNSSSKLKYILERIAEVIEKIDPQQANLFLQSKTLQLDKVTISLTQFRLTLLRNYSIPFQFLIWLLKEAQPDLNDFLAAHYISQSTLTRNVRNLQKYLKIYGIHLSVTNASLESKDELLLRQSLFYLFWMGTKGETKLFEPYDIDESLLPKLLQQIPAEHHYISEKLYRLKLIIQYFRLRQQHYTQENLRVGQLFRDNPLFDLMLCKDNPLIPPNYVRSETGGLVANSLISPNFTDPDSVLIRSRKEILTEKIPRLLSLGDDFLTYFETHYFHQRIEEKQRTLLQLNIAQAGAGIWLFRGTFPNLHYFLIQEEEVNEANLLYEQQVLTFFIGEQAQQYEEYRDYYSTMRKSFGHILRPYYVKHMEWTKLKVGIVAEPNSIIHDKILLVLNSIYFVDGENFRPAESAKYDLVVASTASFKTDYPDIPCFVWNIAAKDEDLPYIFYWLRDFFYQKTGKLRFI
ncbi:helix-turn-helix domain-containing protein [Candidatus Enterococcus leclercqii]|uniref:helix-turn-helix domain-containing protein n=1 Tax=Candidatus Enterococcus leclercqii TaxID=1857218 RepID=UPI0013794DF0|nr:helix-turn-helix domain-containing protein [Enterococcus sp. CU9D]KAF1292828.1 hypothetical protein BAU14_10290 [Enterococcus sp. CU9D]